MCYKHSLQKIKKWLDYTAPVAPTYACSDDSSCTKSFTSFNTCFHIPMRALYLTLATTASLNFTFGSSQLPLSTYCSPLPLPWLKLWLFPCPPFGAKRLYYLSARINVLWCTLLAIFSMPTRSYHSALIGSCDCSLCSKMPRASSIKPNDTYVLSSISTTALGSFLYAHSK